MTIQWMNRSRFVPLLGLILLIGSGCGPAGDPNSAQSKPIQTPSQTVDLVDLAEHQDAPPKVNSIAAPPTDPAIGVELEMELEARKAEQIKVAADLKAFHGFQFTDKHAESGIDFTSRIVDDASKDYKAVHYDHGTGLAAADVDGDGLIDLYFATQIGGNQLWRNKGGGVFENITSDGLGLDGRVSVAAGFADLDNDGDPDLFVTTVRGGNALFENLGDGTFRDVTVNAGLDYAGHSSGVVFFDYDRDGLLDLFVANVGRYTSDERGDGGFYLGYEDGFHGHLYPDRNEPSILYHNEGGLVFKNTTEQLGLETGSVWSGDASACDINEDGYPDLYLLNMQGDDRLFINRDGKRFEDGTSDYFPKTSWGAMGIKFFDYNQDGRLDLFTTDMHSDMTGSQTDEGARQLGSGFEKRKSEAWCGAEWTDAFLMDASNNIFGNSLYENTGDGVFREVSQQKGVETYWPWGVSVADLNSDGFDDVFVTAGMGYPFRYGINSLLLNNSGSGFFDSEFLLGIEPRLGGRTTKTAFVLYCDGDDRDHPGCEGVGGRISVKGALSTRSSVVFDLDQDGDLDLITNEFADRPMVLISDLSDRKNIRWIKIRLVGTASNRDGIGAVVRLTAGNRVWTQVHDGKSGYLGAGVLPLYFGLADLDRIEKVQIAWPSGISQTVTNGLDLNHLVEIRETP